jgi:hypothetical protein
VAANQQSLRAVYLLLFVAPLIAVPALCQESAQPPTPTVVDAARQAREHESQLTKRAPVVTTDDLAPLPQSPTSAAPTSSNANAASSQSAPSSASPAAAVESGGCQNPAQAEELTAELQSAQDERDQIQSDLSSQGPVISDNDLDLHNYKPGNSGIAVGSPPTQESQPEAPARITEVTLDARVASLKKALVIACEPPGQASIQKKLDAIDAQLKLAQQQLALDQAAFYSNTNYASDTAGKARLDAEQQNIDALLAQKDILSNQLPAPSAETPATPD